MAGAGAGAGGAGGGATGTSAGSLSRGSMSCPKISGPEGGLSGVPGWLGSSRQILSQDHSA